MKIPIVFKNNPMPLDLVTDMPVSTSKDIVLQFIKNLNDLDLEAARKHVTDDLEFIGVLGTRKGADSYFADMEKMKLKYSIQKVVFDETDVSLLYNIQMGGKEIFGCGWYHLNSDNKIETIQAIFDPRPVLEG